MGSDGAALASRGQLEQKTVMRVKTVGLVMARAR
jgi:hypothetical protein